MAFANQFELDTALANFRKRCEINGDKIKVRNSDLPAGAPMYFYCRFCGEPTDEKPELYLTPAITICPPCDELNKLGAIPR